MLYSFANLPYWIILGIGVALFIFAIAAGGGDDDLDLDTNADLDSDADFGAAGVLNWLGFGRVPLILLLATDLCFWGLLGWSFNLIAATITGAIPVRFWGLGGLLFVASLVLSLYAGSLVARPVGKLFATFGQDASSDRLVGCLGTVTSKAVPSLTVGRVGQVDVIDPSHNLVTVNAVCPSWATITPLHGQRVLIIDQHSQGYLAIAKDTSDEDRWLANRPALEDTHSHGNKTP
ncbi:MAG: YqiJ family protein [Spirulinaceae cyanobacterium RM2_2_10]|nr:YqiJ family protein [Spirulinaceae cyanobacterium RM2_2_10]